MRLLQYGSSSRGQSAAGACRRPPPLCCSRSPKTVLQCQPDCSAGRATHTPNAATQPGVGVDSESTGEQIVQAVGPQQLQQQSEEQQQAYEQHQQQQQQDNSDNIDGLQEQQQLVACESGAVDPAPAAPSTAADGAASPAAAVADTPVSPDSSSDTPTRESSSDQPAPYFYSPIWTQVSQPVPVQVPPPDADMRQVRTWFNRNKYWSPKFLSHYPNPPSSAYNFMSFLGDADTHQGKYLAEGDKLDQFLASYCNSVTLKNRRMFLAECYGGQPFKFYQELDFPWTLDPQLVLQLIPHVVDIVVREVSQVYADQVPPGVQLKPVLSMRTIYKVHLNFPGITTVESKALEVRKAVVNTCRVELSRQQPLELLRLEAQVQAQWQEAQAMMLKLQQTALQLQEAGRAVPGVTLALLHQYKDLLDAAHKSNGSSSRSQQEPAAPQQQQQQQQQQVTTSASHQQPQQHEPQHEQQHIQPNLQLQQELDWESVIDFPHGSLRLLGSCKAPWMDKDPAWVSEKAYSRVECVGGVWMRQPLDIGSVVECSILLAEGELRVFSQTEQFMDATYHAMSHRDQMTAARRAKRSANRHLEHLQHLLRTPPPDPTMQPQQEQQQQKQEAAAGKAQEQRQLRLQRQQEAEQHAAEKARLQAEQERKKAEAIAKIQAVRQSGRAAELARSSLIRPLARPPTPPAPPPAAPPG